MMLDPQRAERANPLDSVMTKAQVVRRKFKSSLPRTIQNRVLSPMEAMARTMELFDRFRGEMKDAGLKPSDVSAGLLYFQPDTKSEKGVLARVAELPAPDEIGAFVEKVMALDKPRFLGVLFVQTDRETDKANKKFTGFAFPFMHDLDAQKRLKAFINAQAKGGFKKIAN